MAYTMSLLTLLCLLTIRFTLATLVRRDEHSLVIPLTYDPSSNLMTASIAVGTPASTYNLLVDTGSPFLVLQNSTFHATSSTVDLRPESQPMGGGGGFMTTDPNGKDDAEVKPKMHFVTDQAYLVEGSGERAGGGAREGNVTVGLVEMDELQVGGILGLSPPFSHVRPPTNSKHGGNEKRSKHANHHSTAGNPSLDVSFLNSYLSPHHRETLGITGLSHFYLSFSASSPPTGELVFPLTGTTLPNVDGYDFDSAVTVDPSTGSTFPSHPFWGIAHRPDLKFHLNGRILPDVRVDAILLDSGTSGIVAPRSEVEKIFIAANIAKRPPPKGSQAVLGDIDCGAGLEMGFGIGSGKRVTFEAVRRGVTEDDGRWRDSKHDSSTADFETGNDLGLWKSYFNYGSTYTHTLQRWANDWSSFTHLERQHWSQFARRLRRVSKRDLQIALDLATGPQPQEDEEKKCRLSLVGSVQVEKMFPSNGDVKVWIVGMEFFQRNLVYHNVDTAQTVIVPRKEGAGGK